MRIDPWRIMTYSPNLSLSSTSSGVMASWQEVMPDATRAPSFLPFAPTVCPSSLPVVLRTV